MRQLAIQLSGRYDSMKKNLQPISANPAMMSILYLIL